MQTNAEENDWLLAKQGIKLLLNNKIDEAEELFTTHKDNVQMAAGYCFVTFMNALMSFEEEKLQLSLQTLKEMEKRCAQDIGWLKIMKNKVFGNNNSSNQNPAEHLEQQVILADSQVCVALLTFLQQDLSGYVKGGWVLRKAWKVYQHTYAQILQLYRKTHCTEDVPGLQFPSWKVILKRPSNPNLLSPSSDWSVPSNGCSSATTPTSPVSGSLNGSRSPLSIFASLGFQSEPTYDIPPSVVSRLMAAVSFGYGIFQLCISLLPPSLLRLIHFLGFEGDRQVGISALMFARQGQDMRAPLATLALLWYHTIVRPFFALDGSNVRAGVEAAQHLIEESQEEYGSSALFLFFKGRVERLKSNIGGALEAYESAVQASAQREVQLLCLHEVGWCHLIHLSWHPAHTSFLRLKKESRWSKSFYAYLASVCAGASGNLEGALALAHEVPNLASQQRNTQLENFIMRRIQRFPPPTPASENPSNEAENVEMAMLDRHQCTLLAFELLFLWNALPSCSQEGLDYILQECEENSKEPMQGLRQLLKGATWCCQKRPEEAVLCFRTCLVQRGALPDGSDREYLEENHTVEETQEDRHISAFALYELGTLLSKHPETLEEGKCLLLQAQNNYSGYDFENRLNVRIHAALRNIG